jgi:hypothetical protein
MSRKDHKRSETPFWVAVLSKAKADAKHGYLDAMLWLIEVASLYFTNDEYEMIRALVKEYYATATLKITPLFLEDMGLGRYKPGHAKRLTAVYKMTQAVKIAIERG